MGKPMRFLSGLWLLALIPFNPAAVEARYVGGEPKPWLCPTCGSSSFSTYAIDIASGSTLSYAEANLGDSHSAGETVRSAFGVTLSFSAVYNTKQADGSQSRADSVMGYGWTHSYDTLLFSQRGHMFRLGPDGRVTKYALSAGGNYTVTPGYFETLVKSADGSFTRRQKDGTTERFAPVPGTLLAVWRLMSITDRNNNVTTLSYAAGKLTRVTDTYGRSLSFGYTGDLLTQVTDPLGRITRFSYSAGTLVQITDPENKSVQYTYNVLAQITRKVDKDGRVFTYQYNSAQKPVGITDADGNTILSMTNPNNWATDDTVLARNLLRQYIPSTTSKTDGRGNVWNYQYDQNGYITELTAPDGAVTRYIYDAATLQVASVTDANNHTTSYQYDAQGNLLKRTDHLNHVTRYTYEPTFNMMTSMTDANDRTTTYQYDVRGNRVKEIDPLGGTREWTYDSHGNVLTERDKNSNLTIYEYDAFGNRIAETNGAGDVTRFTYDAVGNVVTTTTANGNVIANTYDAKNRLIQVEDRVGLITLYTYDGEGNHRSETDGNRNSNLFVYDLRRRLVNIVDSLGQVTTLTYDGSDNRLSITDRNSNTTTFTNDVQNRISRRTDALGNATKFEYDAVGNLTKIIDANNHATIYNYDQVNRLVKETYADGRMRTFTYDGVGNLLTRIDQKGQTTTYIYDELNRLRRRSYPTNPSDNFTYDKGGRLLTAERGGWVATFTYDGANRVTQTIQNGKTISYLYDIPGRTRMLTYPGGRTITENTDARGRLGAITDAASPPIVRYAYDLGDRVGSRTYRNGATAIYAYNGNDWVLTLDHTSAISRIAGFTYDFDREGNKRFEQKLHDPADSEAYQYDNIYRLVDFRVGTLVGNTVPVPFTQTQYDLDGVDNWKTRTESGVSESRTHSVTNEITQINQVPVLSDLNGNISEDGRYRYAYDEENRLIAVMRKSDSRVVGQYRYDALSRRIAKIADPIGTSSPVETRYFYDGERIIEEQNSGGAALATYVYGNYIDEILTMDRAGQIFYYHQNSLWSVEAVTNSTASVVERYSYDAYGFESILDTAGNPMPENPWGTAHSAIGNPYMFSGRQLDEETDLYFYRARYYDSVKGRFTSRDELGYVNGMNLYAAYFVPNALDPLGTKMCCYDPKLGLCFSKPDAGCRPGDEEAPCCNSPEQTQAKAKCIQDEYKEMNKIGRHVAVEAAVAGGILEPGAQALASKVEHGIVKHPPTVTTVTVAVAVATAAAIYANWPARQAALKATAECMAKATRCRN